MKGDFSRDTFDKFRHFSRVLMQQGRVQLDADWNEQTAILFHYLRTLAADLIGSFAGPTDDGFNITSINSENNNFNIGSGRYYVDGILCENEGKTNGENYTYTYFDQPHYPLDPVENKLPTKTLLMVYLDVWERHLTHFEVDNDDGSVIGIREVALGGPDTATRAQVIWQVKVTDKQPNGSYKPISPTDSNNDWQSWVVNNFPNWIRCWQPDNRGLLKALAKKELNKDAQPCITSPESNYRRAENQLYRVEIHLGGAAGTATFKWSRDNGSVIFPIRSLVGNKATLENFGQDERWMLKKDDWVEIVDDHVALRNKVGPLAQVDSIDLAEQIVTFLSDNLPNYQENDPRHPLLRRWDQRVNEQNKQITNGVPIEEEKWLDLEDGVQVYFEPGQDGIFPIYRSGDYWLIPARTATGDVEWPGPVGKPDARPPHGIEHHYAPLAIISVTKDGKVTEKYDLRSKIKPPIVPA